MGSPLLDKSKAYALRIIKVCNEVKREKRIDPDESACSFRHEHRRKYSGSLLCPWQSGLYCEAAD